MINLLRRVACVALLTVAVAGCDPPMVERQTADALNLVGTMWRAVAVQGQAPVPGREPTMEISVTGVTGNAGCNAWGSGPVIAAGGHFDMGNVYISQVACHEQAVAQVEELFYEAIWQANAFAWDGTGLRLSGPGGEVVFVQVR